MPKRKVPDPGLPEALAAPFRVASTEWLQKVASGEIDARAECLSELANRGLSPEGGWVGFAEAERLRLEAARRLPKTARRSGEILP